MDESPGRRRTPFRSKEESAIKLKKTQIAEPGDERDEGPTAIEEEEEEEMLVQEQCPQEGAVEKGDASESDGK